MKITDMEIEITDRAMDFIRKKMETEMFGLVISYNEVKN